MRTHCCPCSDCTEPAGEGLSRRGFLGTLGSVTAAATLRPEYSWAQVGAAGFETEAAPPRRALVVQPLFIYDTPKPRPQTSWRSWGGIQTQADADAEMGRIRSELAALEKKADFPVRFQPLLSGRRRQDLPAAADIPPSDLILVYAAGGSMQAFNDLFQSGRDILFFVRYRSGPVYLWYEIISPRYLRQHTDQLSVRGITDEDVVVDSQDEILWRLRALCGLRNTLGTKILAVDGPDAWAQPPGVVPARVRELFHFDMPTVTYKELAELIKAARQDQEAVAGARRRAASYLKLQQTTLETKPEFVENAFLLEHVFRGLMKKADCRAITINNCMGTIMPIAETSACLTLSTLNDAGYLAFCESDFVVIPSGVLLSNIAGRPMFLNDPTYPHNGTITLAHCTSPRRLDGRTYERARILTHFESDYGAAPKVEMRNGQTVTNVIPDFAFKRWVGLSGEIIDSPFLPICRSQIDIRFRCDSLKLAERMPGFHWMTIYGDYLRETGYALRRIPIEWENLG